MTGRAKLLYELGVKAQRQAAEIEGVTYPNVAAFAAIIDAAMPAKKERQSNGKAFITGRELHEVLAKRAPDAVIYTPVQPSTVTLAGKTAVSAQLTRGDFELLARWLDEGGLEWMRDKPTFQYVARNLCDLVARARQLDLSGTEESSSDLDRLRKERGL